MAVVAYLVSENGGGANLAKSYVLAMWRLGVNNGNKSVNVGSNQRRRRNGEKAGVSMAAMAAKSMAFIRRRRGSRIATLSPKCGSERNDEKRKAAMKIESLWLKRSRRNESVAIKKENQML
jgi:hypothetical protein